MNAALLNLLCVSSAESCVHSINNDQTNNTKNYEEKDKLKFNECKEKVVVTKSKGTISNGQDCKLKKMLNQK